MQVYKTFFSFPINHHSTKSHEYHGHFRKTKTCFSTIVAFVSRREQPGGRERRYRPFRVQTRATFNVLLSATSELFGLAQARKPPRQHQHHEAKHVRGERFHRHLSPDGERQPAQTSPYPRRQFR